MRFPARINCLPMNNAHAMHPAYCIYDLGCIITCTFRGKAAQLLDPIEELAIRN